MSLKAFNSIQGFSVGQNPTQDIILANGDITTVNFTANGVSNLGPVGNVIITGGTTGYYLQTNGSGNLTWAAVPTGTGISNGTSSVTIPVADGNVNITSGGNTTLVITSTGSNITGTLSVSGDANVGNIGANNGIFSSVSGDGSALSSITGANVTGTVANATYAANAGYADSAGTATTATTAGYATSAGTANSADTALTAVTVTDNAQPNITSTGTLTGLTVDGISNLGNISNVKITGGSAGQTITTDGTGNLTFVAIGGNSAAVMPYFIPSDKSYIVPYEFQGLFTQPIEIDGELEVDGILIEVGTAISSNNSQIIYDNNGQLTGNLGFTFDQSSGNLSIPGNVIASGNLLPTGNLTYSLGNNTNRWNDLYLSGNTIYIGNSSISTTGGNLLLTNGSGGQFVVAGNSITTSNQIVNANSSLTVNPTNVIVSVDSVPNIGVFSATGLTITGTASATGNAIVNGILTDNYYYANGSPLDVGGNPSGSNTYVQFNNNNEFGASANFTFNDSTNILTVVGNANFSNVLGGNSVSANYLISNSGCVTISNGAISVSGSNAGIFNSAISNINLGLVANVVIGSNVGQVTIRNNLFANGNITVQNTLDATNIKVGDLYSSRSPVNVSSNTVIDTFNMTVFRSAKYTIKAGSDFGYQALEVLLIHDNINSIITVYGSLSTAGVDLITLTSNVNSGNIELLATGLGANTVVNLMGTYVPD
jgi:hypothetical protein